MKQSSDDTADKKPKPLSRLIIHLLVKLIPASWFSLLISKLVERRAASLPPADALRFLFDLEEQLYLLQGEKAIAYGNGLHTKHRHTRYHDFFSKRIIAGESVLDIGCGNGALAHDLAVQAGAKVTAIDLRPDNIKQAQDKYSHKQLTFLCGDVTNINFDNNFDVIILSNVLEHLPLRPQFLQKVIAQTAPRRILLRVPLFERDWRVPLKKELGVEWRLDHTHRTEYTLESFAEEIQSAGLEIIQQEVRWGEIWAEVRTFEREEVNCLKV